MNKEAVAQELVRIAKLLSAEALDGLLEVWFKSSVLSPEDTYRLERKMTDIVGREGGIIAGNGSVNSAGVWTISYEVPFSKLVRLRDSIRRLPEWRIPSSRGGGMIKME